jgi:hypothetical protein
LNPSGLSPVTHEKNAEGSAFEWHQTASCLYGLHHEEVEVLYNDIILTSGAFILPSASVTLNSQ